MSNDNTNWGFDSLIGDDKNKVISINRFTEEETPVRILNTKFRDMEVKNRFTSIKGYKEEFVQMINDYLEIDGEVINVENMGTLEGIILARFRQNDILLRADINDGIHTKSMLYYFIEAQSSRDYFIFDRITHYYHLLLEDILGPEMHAIKSQESIKDAYKKLGKPVFIILNNDRNHNKYGIEKDSPVTVFKYSDYRRLYDPNYTNYIPFEYTMFIINDERLEEVDYKYDVVKMYSELKNRREYDDMKTRFNLTERELETIKEEIYSKDLSEDYKEEGREEGREEGKESIYIEMIKNNDDPRKYGCSEELYQQLQEKYGMYSF